MKLDKTLFNTLLAAYNENGPSSDVGCDASDYTDCGEAQVTIDFLAMWGLVHEDIRACIGTALQAGFEVGLQYAELTRSGVKS